jgi:drug/metabolite transporter (DMT)-like permease
VLAGAGEHPLTGVLLVVGAVVLYGGYLAAARALRSALPADHYAALVYLVAAVAAVVAIPLAPWPSGVTVWPLPGHSLLAIAGLALVPTLVGHTAVQAAARRTSPSTVALVSPGETVGAIAIGALWLGAVPSPTELAGALVIICGVTVAIFGAPREP